MLRKKAWFVLVMLAVLLPSTVLAQEMMHGKWWNNSAVADEVKLTDTERERLDAKYTEGRRGLIDLKSEVEKERLELDIILDKQDANKDQITERFNSLEKAREKLSKERFGMLLEMREIIGAERFQTLKEIYRSKKGKKGRHSRGESSRRGGY